MANCGQRSAVEGQISGVQEWSVGFPEVNSSSLVFLESRSQQAVVFCSKTVVAGKPSHLAIWLKGGGLCTERATLAWNHSLKSSSGICTILSRTNWNRKKVLSWTFDLFVREITCGKIWPLWQQNKCNSLCKQYSVLYHQNTFNATFRTAGYALKQIKRKTLQSSLQFISWILPSQVFVF